MADRKGMMEVVGTYLNGVVQLRPRILKDDRGHFLETFHLNRLKELTGYETDFVQDNESMSHAGVLRGLHFQEMPYAQGKLVRVLSGAVLDVAVDIRAGSPTYGHHVVVRLDSTTKDMLWIPPGFAHGFVALEDHTVFSYKCTAYYHQPSERTVLWNDPDLAIDWGVDHPRISAKDQQGMLFHSYTPPQHA